MLASVHKKRMIDRWENPECLVFSLVNDRCARFLMAIPKFLGMLAVRVVES